jgi:hypothetical protein
MLLASADDKHPRGLANPSDQVGRNFMMHNNAHVVAVDLDRRTVVAGTDPAASVLDPWCKAHDVENLSVVDAGFFPSSAAMNPALTIAAQALRVAAESDLTA